jgi:hypothetical protein
MKMKSAYRALGVGAVAMLLAGCGAALAPNAGLRGSSEIDATARGSKLLYTASDACSVYVFAYPRGKLVQTLDACAFGFGPAFGLCSDKRGNVYMAMGEGFSVLEIAHGGTEPIAQYQDDSLLPTGCSIDPATGDLGVASATGNVAVFKNATSTPQIYSLADIADFFFCTFDDRGNLFADGEHSDRSFALAELPKGGSALREITVSGKVQPGFGIQWDGRRVAIGATQEPNEFTLDRIRIAGSVAKVIGTTTLDGAANTSVPFQFLILNGTIVQPEDGNTSVGVWNYPAGGEQSKVIRTGGSNLVGVTVSP